MFVEQEARKRAHKVVLSHLYDAHNLARLTGFIQDDQIIAIVLLQT